MVAEIASNDDNRLLISTVNLAEAVTRMIDKGMALSIANENDRRR